MTGPMQDHRPARDNETEHADLSEKAGELASLIALGNASGLEESVSVREAAFSLDEEQHNLLEERLHDVETALKEDLGEKKVTVRTVRTVRHIHSGLIGVRILELDHFENEEAFIIPLVVNEIGEAGQLDIVHRLLIDEAAEEPRWVIDWVYSELNPAEQAQPA